MIDGIFGGGAADPKLDQPNSFSNGSKPSFAPKTFKSPFWNASWIWPIDASWDIFNSYALFRKKFHLEQLPRRAPLFITADQSYRLFVNGHFVARGPARGFQSHWPYDEIDLLPFLREGENLLAVRAHHPGRGNFQYRSADTAGLLVAAEWAGCSIVSDAQWRSLRQESASPTTVPSSKQLFSQEHVDLRKEQGDWTCLDFDDSAWISPCHKPWNSGPWYSLEPRGIPQLLEKEMDAGRLIGMADGISASGYKTVRDVVALRFRETRGHAPALSDEEILEVKPIAVGKFRSYLFDFGKTMVGNISLEIAGAVGGEIIDTHYAETIDRSSLTPDLVIPAECRMAIGDRLTCRAGQMTHHFYHHYGFRYLTLTVRDAPQGMSIRRRLHWIGYPLEIKGRFASSDGALEKIWKICAWTQQCCSLDAYVDTPWREQAQWWGDARVQGWTTFHLSGDSRLFRRGISQIADQTTPDGLTFGHAPTASSGCVLPDFTLMWLLTLWDHYWQTGSLEAFSTHRKIVKNALAYFERHLDAETGLVAYDRRYWLFLDWTDLLKDRFSAVYNLWLLIALEKLEALHLAAGNPGEAENLNIKAQALRLALSRLIDKNGFIHDGIDITGRIVPDTSIHAQTLALTVGLEGMREIAVLESLILPFFRGEIRAKAPPSAYWVTYVFHLLSERGFGGTVVDFIKKYWLPMVDHGTTWELFEPQRGVQSFSHAWSAHPLYHLMQIIGGVTPLAPGWKAVRFHPLFYGESCRTETPTPRGMILASWDYMDSKCVVELSLPPGVMGHIELPGCPAEQVSGTTRWILEKTEKIKLVSKNDHLTDEMNSLTFNYTT